MGDERWYPSLRSPEGANELYVRDETVEAKGADAVELMVRRQV